METADVHNFCEKRIQKRGKAKPYKNLALAHMYPE